MGPGCGPLGPIGNRGLGPNPGPWSGDGPIPGLGPCMKGSGPLGGNGGRIPGRIMSGGGGPIIGPPLPRPRPMSLLFQFRSSCFRKSLLFSNLSILCCCSLGRSDLKRCLFFFSSSSLSLSFFNFTSLLADTGSFFPSAFCGVFLLFSADPSDRLLISLSISSSSSSPCMLTASKSTLLAPSSSPSLFNRYSSSTSSNSSSDFLGFFAAGPGLSASFLLEFSCFALSPTGALLSFGPSLLCCR